MEYSVSEMAKLVGVSPRTLRYYEQEEVVTPPVRTYAKYRVYDGNDVAEFTRVRRLTQMGFTLAEIRVITQAPDTQEHARLLQKLKDRLDAQAAEIARQQRLAEEMLAAGKPLDLPPELAEIARRNAEICYWIQDEEREKKQLELLAKFGDESAVARMDAINDAVESLAGTPDLERLRDVEVRFYALGSDSTEEEIEAVISGYTEVLTVVFTKADPGPRNPALWEAVVDMFNEQQARVMEATVTAVRERLKSSNPPA